MNEYTCPNCKRKVEELHPVSVGIGATVLRCEECKEFAEKVKKPFYN